MIERRPGATAGGIRRVSPTACRVLSDRGILLKPCTTRIGKDEGACEHQNAVLMNLAIPD